MLSENAKNHALDGININRIQLHEGDPGVNGTDNALGSKTTASFDAASGGVRQLSANVNFSGLGASANVTHYSIWRHTGGPPLDTFQGSAEITEGDNVASAEGTYTLLAADTAITIP